MPRGAPDFWQVTISGMPIIGSGQEAWFMSESISVGATGNEDLINYVVPDDYELHVTSGVVSCNFPALMRYDIRTSPAGTWIFPTSHIDPDNKWSTEVHAYDNTPLTVAFTPVDQDQWSSYLEFLVNETYIDKIRFNALYISPGIDEIDVDIYYEGAWHDVYEGAFPYLEWLEKDIPAGVKLVSKARVRFYNSADIERYAQLDEFQFNTSGVSPQEGIYFDTHTLIPFTSEAPYIVQAGATFAVRVYNDDDAAHNMAVSLAGFLQSKV